LNGPAEVIVVQPGIYTGNFTIKAKATKTLVRGLTFEGRATPKLRYPQLVAQDPLTPVLNSLDGAHDYTFVGLEFTGVAPDRDTLVIGPLTMTEVAQVPVNITFEQCYVHGVNGKGHRGLMFNVVNGVLTRNYFSDFVEQGRDSQAVGIIGGPGPYTFTDNYFEASGENIMFGGADPKIRGAIPGPALISGNTFFKPPVWKTRYPGSVKNLFELKNAHDITIKNNVFENVWVDAQAGNAIVFTPRNQDGTCPWCNVTNVLFACNEVRNVAGFAVSILGTDNLRPSGTADNLVLTQNLFTSVSGGVAITGPVKHLDINRNVFVGIKARFLSFGGMPNAGFSFVGNATGSGEYGITGDNTGVGSAALARYAPDAVFIRNRIETTAARVIGYPAGNTTVAPNAVTAAEWSCTP